MRCWLNVLVACGISISRGTVFFPANKRTIPLISAEKKTVFGNAFFTCSPARFSCHGYVNTRLVCVFTRHEYRGTEGIENNPKDPIAIGATFFCDEPRTSTVGEDFLCQGALARACVRRHPKGSTRRSRCRGPRPL